MKDIIDRDIRVGDYIAIATQSYGELKVGKVLDLVKKEYRWSSTPLSEPNMVRVITVGSSRWGDTYPSHLLKLDVGFGTDVPKEKFAKLDAYYELYTARKKYSLFE